jgi:hypothetical protein
MPLGILRERVPVREFGPNEVRAAANKIRDTFQNSELSLEMRDMIQSRLDEVYGLLEVLGPGTRIETKELVLCTREAASVLVRKPPDLTPQLISALDRIPLAIRVLDERAKAPFFPKRFYPLQPESLYPYDGTGY